MANANIKAVITAEDRASPVVKGFGDNVTKSVFTATAAFTVLSAALEKTTSFLGSSVTSANKYQSAMLGLSTVSAAFGVNTNTANEAAKKLAADGLMTVTDAAAGLKNLLASGFSLDQAIILMNRFKDSAAFGRQGALGFGEAIRGATEGIKNGNSILVDNAGVTKNLSVILEEAGFSAQDLMKATTDASVRQAIFNGIIRETAPNMGDAAKLTGTFAGAEARAAAQTETLKQSIGQMVQAVTGGAIAAFGEFLEKHQRLIISFGAAAAAAIALGGALFLVVAAIKAFSLASVIAAASNPLLMLLTAISILAGVVVYKAVDKMQKKVADANSEMLKTSDVMKKDVPEGANKSTKAMSKLGDQIADINDQIAKAKRGFHEQLAEMIKSHQDKVTDLKKQLSDEESDFKSTQDQQAEDHQDKVNRIKAQIDEEVAKGRLANDQKLSDLSNELDQENKAYNDQKAKEDAQHAEKIAKMQSDLDAETALLNKHAADVNSIRDVQLLDEIDKLKRTHKEELDEFDKQKKSILKNADETTKGVGNVWDNASGDINNTLGDMGKNMGTEMGNAFKQALKDSLMDVVHGIGNIATKASEAVTKKAGLKYASDAMVNLLSGGDSSWKSRASGGPVQAGQMYAVGDNPDGSWNDTTELFIPGRSGTMVPSRAMGSMGGGQTNLNVSVNVGMYAGSQLEKRRMAEELFKALKDVAATKNMSVADMMV